MMCGPFEGLAAPSDTSGPYPHHRRAMKLKWCRQLAGLEQGATRPLDGAMDVGLNMLIAIAIYIVVLLLVAWWTNRRRPSPEIGRAVQQECRDRSRMPSSA
eukprot:TRINITY_DN2873_c0_g1_i21.p1 TRINITY_DN2873_c0_g1~~TRINITY_DN2873_c0_g1_i21.p1  ORF type:complete len:101 (+),score=14.87 TRINITY_DN2873_c0_g1_i21:286-588(+)